VTGTVLGLAMIGGLLALLALRIPVGLAMLVAGGAGYVAQRGVDPLLYHLQTTPFFQASTHSYAVIPLFLLMGQFATQSGINRALFDAARAYLGHRRGGLALASIAGSAGFGAICGSSLATAATMAQAALPEMRQAGYAGSLATATLAAGGTLGILIPPSFVLVIYALLTEQLIGTMFLAALVPGALAVLGFTLAIRWTVQRDPGLAPLEEQADRSARQASLGSIWIVPVVFLVVIGGIYRGWFTPTEGAAVGAAATAVLAVARGMRWEGLKAALLGTIETAAMVFLILLGADLFSAGLAFTRLPQELVAVFAESGLPAFATIGLMLLFYLAAGCVMDSLSVILLTVPVFFPIVMALDLGMGPTEAAVWFGILALVVVELGLITPPVGMNVFVIHGLARDIPLGETFRGLLPFLAIELIRVALLFAIPGLVLWLPALL